MTIPPPAFFRPLLVQPWTLQVHPASLVVPLAVALFGVVAVRILARAGRSPTAAGALLGPILGIGASLAAILVVRPCGPHSKICLFHGLLFLAEQRLELVLVASVAALVAGRGGGGARGWAAAVCACAAVGIEADRVLQWSAAMSDLQARPQALAVGVAASVVGVGACAGLVRRVWRDWAALALIGSVVAAAAATFAVVGAELAQEALRHGP